MSDLDARVAALMKMAFACSGDTLDWSMLQQAIRAELQKPALHEPDEEEKLLALASEMLSCWRMVERNGEPEGAAMQASNDFTRALHIALQGRAKPTQEEITDEHVAMLKRAMDSAGIPQGCRVPLIGFFCNESRASKGEKT